MSLVVLTVLLLLIYYRFPFQTAYVCEVRNLNNFCIFIMLLHCPFGSFFRVFAQEVNCKDFLQDLLLQNSGRNITIVKRKEKVFLTLIHTLSARRNASAWILRGKACSSSVSLAWVAKRSWESLRLGAGANFHVIFFSTFLFQSPLNIISLLFAKQNILSLPFL